CDWAAHDDLSNGPILSDEFSLKNIEEVNDFSKRSSVHMDYYLMDAFWFEENKGYMNFKPSTFPEGSKNVVKKLDEYGMKYGLWFDINFIHAHMEGWEKYDSMINKGASCFALDEVANLMTEAVAKHIVEDGVKLLKFDFAYFECKNPEHGHSIETTESKERSIVNFIKMVERLREIEPKLVILCYNGWTVSLDWIGCVCERAGYAISPYWCKYIDYLYCGDPRPSEIATKDMENSLVYYSDAMIRNFRDSFIPFKYIDDHGTMVGETDTIYNLGDKLFRSTTLLNVMRGTEKMSPYGQVTNLTDEDAEYFRYVNSIFNVAVNGGYTCSFILGDIRKGEVYGYSIGGSQYGYAIILNPLKHFVNVNVKLEQWGDVNVSVVKRIENGDIVSSRASTANGGIAVPVAANGYVLLEWRVADDKTEGQFVTVCPNEKLAFCTENISAVALSFKKADDGTPVRTAFGYPEGLTVKSGDDQLKANVSNCVWSGISWLYFELSGEKEVCIEYSGNEILLMKYELIKESGK
ncbi:MAG: hypothetical protein IJV67_07370, partial [Clostridia bacterium]|nr:hypothetical protein [Clostridia bacterium]